MMSFLGLLPLLVSANLRKEAFALGGQKVRGLALVLRLLNPESDGTRMMDY